MGANIQKIAPPRKAGRLALRRERCYTGRTREGSAMISFASDYAEGAHPRLLERLAATNLESAPGYGADKWSERARQKIRQACACPEAEVFFLMGGTQTNQVVIDALLPPYAGVLAAATGHVCVHEAGAIEYTGHKVLPLPSHDGKLDVADLRQWIADFHADANHEHMVFPGMAYISHPSEYGTLYTRAELAALYAACTEYGIPLFLDGARLGYALACPESDVRLPDVAALTDAFSIGGTKVGALCGEAVVFPRGGAPAHFLTRIKQHGALLAKGRLLGVQFDALFSDGLYVELGRNAIRHAATIREALRARGYRLYGTSPTNQIFLVLEDARYAALRQRVEMSFWERVDAGHVLVRLATSWATTDAAVQALLAVL